MDKKQMNKNKKINNSTKDKRKLKDIDAKYENNKKKEKKKKKKKKHTFLRLLLAVFIILLISVISFLVYSVLKNGWGIKGVLQTALGQSEEKLQDLDPFTVLILGVSEDISVELTDTIMVASYNPKTQKATLLSIPRDTFVGKNKNKATSYDKINALYQKDVQKTVDAVNELTGMNIEYYIAINNNALIELVDEIGGVEFDVPIDMKYDDSSQDLHINLKKGYQKLNGEQAEWLVRFRKNNNGTTYSAEYGDNDIGRMKTQREFIKAVANQTLKFKNITKLKSLMTIFKENVTTNITDWDTVSAYIPYAVEFNTENMRTETLPGTTDKYNNLWFFIANKKETTKLIDELLIEQNGVDDENEAEKDQNTIEVNNLTSNSTVDNKSNSKSENTLGTTTSNESKVSSLKVEILNGTGDSKILTEVTNLLKNKGYNVYKTGTTSASSKTTIVNKSDVDGDITTEIKNLLGIGSISKSVGSSSNVDITIVIGKDYKDK